MEPSASLPDLTGVRIACCSRNHKRAALLFDHIIYGETILEEPLNIPHTIAYAPPKIIEMARESSHERGMAALPVSPQTFTLGDFWAVHRDATLVDIAKICRTQGAQAAVLDLSHPEVLVTRERPSAEVGIVASLSRIPVAIESELSWEQVEDFRDDEEAIRKYRASLVAGVKSTCRV
jgi:hypothetical protein